MDNPEQEVITANPEEADPAGFHAIEVPPLHMRVLRYLTMLILLGLAVHLILPQIVSLGHSVNVLTHMTWWLVAAAVAAQLISYLGGSYMVSAMVAMIGHKISLARAMLITLSSNSVGLLVGGVVGSSASAYRWFRQGDLDAKSASLASTLPAIFNNVLLIVLAVFGLAHLLFMHQLTEFEKMGFAVLLVIDAFVLVVIIWSISYPALLVRLLDRLLARRDKLRRRPHNPHGAQEFVDQMQNTWMALRLGGWRGPSLGALLNTGFDLLTLYFLFWAAGYQISFGMLLTGYGVPLLLGKVSFLPGGVGIVEATMVAMYAGLGVPVSTATVVVLAYRILSFRLPTVLGFASIPVLERVVRGTAAS